MDKELLLVLAGRFLQVITSIGILRIVTGLLDPFELGKYSLILSITSFFALVFINPVGTYINRKLHAWYEKGIVWYRLVQGAQYVLCVTAVAIAIIFGMYSFSDVFSNLNVNWLILLVSTSLLFTTCNQTIIPAFNMLGYRKQWVIYSILTLWVGLGASIIFTFGHHQAEYWIAGQTAGMFIGSVIAIIPFRHILKNETVLREQNLYNDVKSVLMFSLPIAIGVGLNWVQFQSYRFIITDINGLDFLGIFIAGYTVSSGILGAFETTAMNYFYPFFYSKISNADDAQKAATWNQYASVMLPLTMYTSFFVIVMAQQIIHVLADPRFWIAVKYVQFGALIEMGRIIGNIYGMVAHSTMNTKTLILPQLIGSLSTVLFIPLFNTLLPETGVGVALTVSAGIYIVCMHFATRKQLNIIINFRDLCKKVLFMIPIAGGWLVAPLFKSNIINDLLLLMAFGLIYIIISYISVRGTMNYGNRNHT